MCLQSKININHVLTYKTGGFVIFRHNKTVNITAAMLSMICKDVRKEPILSTTLDSNDELRADLSMHSFWQRLQKAYVDVRVFYPFAPSYWDQSLATVMKTLENQKIRKCSQLILDGENGYFTPLVFTTNAGMSTETKYLYRWINQLLCEKSDVSYIDTVVLAIVSFEHLSFA